MSAVTSTRPTVWGPRRSRRGARSSERSAFKMELFGAKFSIALGAWKLRFVLMLEDDEAAAPQPSTYRAPHHVTAQRPLGGTARHT